MSPNNRASNPGQFDVVAPEQSGNNEFAAARARVEMVLNSEEIGGISGLIGYLKEADVMEEAKLAFLLHTVTVAYAQALEDGAIVLSGNANQDPQLEALQGFNPKLDDSGLSGGDIDPIFDTESEGGIEAAIDARVQPLLISSEVGSISELRDELVVDVEVTDEDDPAEIAAAKENLMRFHEEVMLRILLKAYRMGYADSITLHEGNLKGNRALAIIGSYEFMDDEEVGVEPNAA